MTARWRGVVSRVLAGAAVGVAVGLLYDRNTRAFVLPPDAGVDWGAVLAAAVTLGSLLVTYEVLAWLLRLGIRRLTRVDRVPGATGSDGGPPADGLPRAR